MGSESQPRSDATQTLPEAFSRIQLVRLFVTLRALEPARISRFSGPTLRGALMSAYYRMVCVSRRATDCGSCLVRHACSYAYLFETPLPPGSQYRARQEDVPRPMVIQPPLLSGDLPPGGCLEFGLVLFGRASEWIPFLVVAIRLMAERGLGPRRARFELARVRSGSADGPIVFEQGAEEIQAPAVQRLSLPIDSPAPDRAIVEFVTPTRLTEGGTITANPTFRTLVRSILSRAEAVARFHCATDLAVPVPDLLASASTVQVVSRDLRVVPMERFSTRQNQPVRLDGLVGTLGLSGEALRGLWPVLQAGVALHVGRGTIFGLGRLRAFANAEVA